MKIFQIESGMCCDDFLWSVLLTLMIYNKINHYFSSFGLNITNMARDSVYEFSSSFKILVIILEYRKNVKRLTRWYWILKSRKMIFWPSNSIYRIILLILEWFELIREFFLFLIKSTFNLLIIWFTIFMKKKFNPLNFID